jgi:hypothetical protein
LNIDKTLENTKIFKTKKGNEVSEEFEKYPFIDKDQILNDNESVNKIYDFNKFSKDYEITYYKWDLINVDEKIDNILVYKINEENQNKTLQLCIFKNLKAGKKGNFILFFFEKF